MEIVHPIIKTDHMEDMILEEVNEEDHQKLNEEATQYSTFGGDTRDSRPVQKKSVSIPLSLNAISKEVKAKDLLMAKRRALVS